MTTTGDIMPADLMLAYDRELAWLDRLIELEILRLRARYELSLDELRGLYISDRQVDELLRQNTSPLPVSPVDYLTREARAQHDVPARVTPLEQVQHRFALSAVEADVLLVTLAPEIALKYETLYAYLNNDITRKHTTVDLTIRLLGTFYSEEQIRNVVRPGSRLFVSGLMEWIEPGAERRSSRSLGFALAIPVVHFLLGLPLDDPRLPASVQLKSTADLDAGAVHLAPPARNTVEEFTMHYPRPRAVLLCVADSPREHLGSARVYARQYGYHTIAVPISSAAADPPAWPALRTRLTLLATLAPAIVVLHDDGDGAPRDPSAMAQCARVVRELAAARVPLFLPSSRHSQWTAGLGEIPFAELTLPELSGSERAATWRAALREHGLETDAEPLDQVGHRFVLSYSRIIAAAATAAQMCGGQRDPDNVRESVWRAARGHSSHSLSQLATRVVKPHTWDQLVLPESTLRRIREIASAIGQRDRVFHGWRMAVRTGRGSGLMILFAGASGTGKTMTAAVIANGLGLELYRIDLASIVSKYIGETEKNLERVFEAARRSNGILLFDEADALLGKRSEIKDAHDRYANIEVAYLLQKMEEHDGVVILATNLSKNLDQAFARRMHYVVDFPRPDASLRERLWAGMFPPETPLAADIDFPFLAKQFDTPGGDIQGVALDAAFLASAENRPIGMCHVIQAMARHQLKQGNPASVGAFKQYFDLVRGDPIR